MMATFAIKPDSVREELMALGISPELAEEILQFAFSSEGTFSSAVAITSAQALRTPHTIAKQRALAWNGHPPMLFSSRNAG